MKGDFSKKTFDARKHYKDVNMQQGRVLLDTDWNEQNDITDHRIETETIDTIGSAGAPIHAAGFEIITVDNAGNPVTSNGVDLKISAGRFYTDGILCENETTILYKDQPDFLATPLPSQVADAGVYMFYLDVWERHITAFEDATIREVALNGADTTTRTKTVWQVKYKKLTAPVTCLTDLPPEVLGPTDILRGKLNAKSEAGSSTGGPCGLVTSGGYRGLANQLYRIEIHKAGTRATATFKWSREDGSVLATWDNIDSGNANNLIVKNPGRDDLLGFKSGDWVELIGDTTDLLIKPGVLVRLAKVEGNVLTIDPTTINDPEGTPGTAVARVFAYNNPRIRRWDMQKDKNQVTDNGEIDLDKSTWIELEDGVKVEFKTGDYLSGDYWLIPARTAEANIEWPFTTPQLPLGIKHHFAKLAVCTLSFSGAIPQWMRNSDCRPVFPPITELISLYYVGGDGQEAMPGKPLPNTLKVGVTNIGIVNEHRPVVGANVKFEILAPGVGTLSIASGIVATNAQGIAECGLTLGSIPPNVNFSLQVKASLLDAAGNTLTNYLPVIFTAGFSDAANVSYTGGDCNNWGTPKPTTVAEALTALCKRENEDKGDCCSITVGEKGEYKTIGEALFDLRLKKVLDVSLCLLPGDHRVDKSITIEAEESQFRTIHITGYAAYIKMTAQLIKLSAGKIILEGFVLKTDKEANNGGHIILNAPLEINIDHCEFFRGGDSLAPFVIINRTAILYLKNSKIVSLGALVFENGVQGVVESNLISFLILQNEKPGGTAPLLWNAALKKTTMNDLKETIKNLEAEKPDRLMRLTDWSLTLRGNFFSKVLTDVARQFPQDIYKNLIVSENLFQLNNNSFVAQYLNIAHNHFLFFDPLQTNPNINAFVVGFNVVIIGNKGATRSGQLQSAIEVISLGMLIGLQQLNLLAINNN